MAETLGSILGPLATLLGRVFLVIKAWARQNTDQLPILAAAGGGGYL